jgi:hypothetical protein
VVPRYRSHILKTTNEGTDTDAWGWKHRDKRGEVGM